jgi:hypothetical protein
MATVSITEILGSDNIAGSRITINSNFSTLATAINNIETRLDTSFTPGGSLNVGNALIKRYTNPVTSQIFTCEASALFQGNLNVSKTTSITEALNVGLDLLVSGNVVFDDTATNGSSFVSELPFDLDAALSSPQLDGQSASNAYLLNPQTLAQTPSSSVREITAGSNFPKISVIRLNYSTYDPALAATSCTKIQLPAVSSANVTPGQIITVIIDQPAATGTTGAQFGISSVNLASGYNQDILMSGITATFVDSDSYELRKAAITLYADTQVGNGWRVLNSTPYVAY